MIYRLDAATGEIREVTAEEARRALQSYGWTAWSVNDFFRSAKVLCTSFFYFSRFRNRLEEFRAPEVV
jgi:hypothetical protein